MDDREFNSIAVHQIGDLWYFGQDLAARQDLRARDNGTGTSHVIHLPDRSSFRQIKAYDDDRAPISIVDIPEWGCVTAGSLVELAEQAKVPGIYIAATVI